ncbi:hypothetical protein [Rhodococcus sp. KB6]|uniref:hypothetical protein n=1 Tax=Rhodococcus sp. KB6 TaxID=1752066 RepID=UPI000AC97F24|nr:hypothetical protein [Rhodococcus sp. KB6]
MRLSELLNNAPDTTSAQVENFLGYRKIAWGKRKPISVGRVVRNHYCLSCGDTRSFVSGEALSCLISAESVLSIDVALRCSGCESGTEAWFLVGCGDDLYSQAPEVNLQRFTENRRDVAANQGLRVEQIDDLFERAQIAFDDSLGAGAMVYLRKIFEAVTSQAADAVGLSTRRSNGKRRDFRSLLAEVDATSHIIPSEFSEDGYTLFSELSEVIHGDSDELRALEKYDPCRRLILGIVNNVRNREELAEAITSLGWPSKVGQPTEGRAS